MSVDPVDALAALVVPPPKVDRFVDGATFILDAPAVTEAVWGTGEQVLWPKGEPFLLCGPTGVGKTTLATQVLFARLGLIPAEVLGFAVEQTTDKVLYIAADRPNQVARAWRRCVSDGQREELRDRLVVWRGPPPTDVTRDPGVLLDMADDVGARTVFVDSVKDISAKLSDDEAGIAINTSFQLLIAEGIEAAGLHHQRKAQQGQKPKSIDDVYGSTWLVAGMGSVGLLWGQPGDLVVDWHHLKQPSAEVGPLKLEHDHHTGVTSVYRGFDVLRWLRNQPRGGTAPDAARQMFEKEKPSDNERKKAQRELERLVRAGLAVKKEAVPGGAGGGEAARYYVDELAVGALDEASE